MSDDRPKNLKNLFGEDENSSKSIQELMADDAAAARAEAGIGAEESTQSKNRKVLLGVGIGGALLLCGALFNPWAGVVDYGKADGPKVKTAAGGGNVRPAPVEKAWYEEGTVDLPIEVGSPYLKKAAEEVAPGSATPQEIEGRAMFLNTKYIDSAAATLIGEDSGFTSDTTKALNKDGTINFKYQYITSDIFIAQTGDIVNRLINPVYGGWGYYQTAASNARNNLQPSALGPIFSEAYLAKHATASDNSYLPVYADWQGNDYGLKGSLLPEGPRWVGNVTEASLTMKYNKKTINYVYNATYNVTFTAWTKDKQKLSRNGVLTVRYITDTSAASDAKAFRLKIDDAQLAMSN